MVCSDMKFQLSVLFVFCLLLVAGCTSVSLLSSEGQTKLCPGAVEGVNASCSAGEPSAQLAPASVSSKPTFIAKLTCPLITKFGRKVVSPCLPASTTPSTTVTLPSSQRSILLPPRNNTVWHGVWIPAPSGIDITAIEQFEQDTGKSVSTVLYYVNWNENSWTYTASTLVRFDSLGVNGHIVWEPWIGDEGALDAILDGSQDGLID